MPVVYHEVRFQKVGVAERGEIVWLCHDENSYVQRLLELSVTPTVGNASVITIYVRQPLRSEALGEVVVVAIS